MIILAHVRPQQPRVFPCRSAFRWLHAIVPNGMDVSVLIGKTDDTFNLSMSFAAGDMVQRIHVGDIDGDADLLLLDAPNALRVLPGFGNGMFDAPAAFPLPGAYDLGSIAFADLNDDGLADIACGDPSTNTLVLHSSGRCSFASRERCTR